MGEWLTDFRTDALVLGACVQTTALPLYSLGNEMSLACGWLPRTWGKYIVTEVLMKTVRMMDSHEEIIGLSGHLLAVSRKA